MRHFFLLSRIKKKNLVYFLLLFFLLMMTRKNKSCRQLFYLIKPDCALWWDHLLKLRTMKGSYLHGLSSTGAVSHYRLQFRVTGGARITTTIVYSKNIHFSQCDGTTTIFHLCLILTTILCRSNIPLCVVQTSMFDANDVITSTSFF